MAEKLVSPGVFTQEKDVSFLPVGIGQIGAALIGPTLKGPAFRPTVVTSYQEFIDKFGDLDSSTYLPYTAKAYLRSAGSATIIRIMGSENWTQTNAIQIQSDTDGTILAVLMPVDDSATIASLSIGGTGTADDFDIDNGTETLSNVSFLKSSPNYIGKLFSTSPNISGSGITNSYYLYRFFPNTGDSLAVAADNITDSATAGGTSDFAFTGTNSTFQNAKTPWVTAQRSAGTALRLFRVGRISDGVEGNYDVKVTIEDIRKSGNVPGTAYGSFNLYVRRVGGLLGSNDTDQNPEVLETFLNINLDPSSPNYILKRIGDMYSSVDQTGKITMYGDFPNKSKYIYIIPADGFDNLPPSLYPFGFEAPNVTHFDDTGITSPVSMSFVTLQGTTTRYDNRVAFGFNFYDADCRQLLYSIPDGVIGVTASLSGSGAAGSFNLSDMKSHPLATTAVGTTGGTFPAGSPLSHQTASVEMLKFAVPFQGGHDGLPYNRTRNIGADITNNNVYGFNCSTPNSSGSLAYIKALNVLSNPDEYDINLIVTPGIISSLHSSITTKAIQVCENRGDCFYIMDTTQINDSISQAVANVSNFDTNYAATYYPWVKIQDSVSKKVLWVPPTVVVPGVISNNDKLSYEWFAPAGLNRGGIPEATQVYYRLTQADRDNLYLNRINPIASFPNSGVCVWGQKTLQAAASALDRINVRRLLIATKKYIASATKYLVFEQNNTQTRNRFLNIVNPYLESVKSRQGLYAFKVVMDETLNTADLIDRNIMYGQIFLQPTRTAEFILIDFNIQPTGASFSS
jgi:hypothetical protein